MHGLIFNINISPLSRNSGGHRIATVLRQNEWDVEVFDFAYHVDLKTLQEFVKQRINNHTKFFGFSTFFSQWNDNLSYFTSWLKKYYPDVPIILGGQNAVTTPATNIDFWVDSFGDKAIIELLAHITNSSSEPIKFDKSFKNKRVIKSIHSYPAYPQNSYAVIYEKRDFISPYEWLTVEFSRGCRFKCDFCSFPILGVKGDYSRSKEDFEQELKRNYESWGVKNYYIADETFNDRPDKIKKFAEVVDEKIGFDPYFSGFMRGDLLVANPNTWNDLKTLGVYGQYYGVETFNQQAGKNIGKGMDPNRLKNGLLEYKKFMSERPFRASLSFIIGLPYETFCSLNQTLEWLKENWTDQSISSYFLELGFNDIERLIELTNISEMRLNPKKYGLEEMDRHRFVKKLEEKQARGNIPSIDINDTFLWQHENMDIVDALEINDKFTKLLQKGKIDNWNLHQLSLRDARHIDNVESFDITKNDLNNDIKMQQKTNSFIRNYIDRKLE
jgi:hypothetical protein